MLARYIKPVLELVPEVMPFVKQASVDKDMPVDGRDSTIASALAIEYMVKVAHTTIDLEEFDKVASAVKMYGVADEVNSYKTLLVKRANEQLRTQAEEGSAKETYLEKEAYFKGELSGFMNYYEVVDSAKDLYKQAELLGLDPCDEVVNYSGNGFLNKEAAVKSLSVRYNLTGNGDFVKLASAISITEDMNPTATTKLCAAIHEMDKTAGLAFRGFNFHREAIITKEAAFNSAMLIKVDGKDVPYEKFEKLGKSRISQYIGKDVANEMDKGPQQFKSVIETLPLDLQRVITNLLKNV